MENKDFNEKRSLIANRLKEARILSGLSQKEVAELIDFNRPTIAEIEAGRRKVSAEEILRFSTIYKVSSSWLMDVDEDEEFVDFKDLRFAARELGKLNQEDRLKVLQLINMITK